MKIEIFSKPNCIYCDKSKTLLKGLGLSYIENSINDYDTKQEFLEAINSYILNLGPYAVGKMLRLEPDHVEINTILKFINEDKYYRKWNK